ncbi:Protein zerknuellt 1 [Eumeta japonica]|uniref:Protein zerknuellt 1 n=1 Tax=Eumeta variegata TaxID=151549 RepID=A0A4C1VNN8_EUMVA|nr:Protein zerknuellt 1 [Eumeta japonica]
MSDPHWKKPLTWQEELRQRLMADQGRFPSIPNQVITYYHPTVNEKKSKKKHKRTRIAFTGVQIACLEAEFKKSMYLQAVRRRELSEYLGLSERNIKVWFQNKRMKEKNTLKTNNEEVATDLRICQPLAQQMSNLPVNLTGDTKTNDDVENDEPEDEQSLKINVNSIDATEIKTMEEPPHIEVLSSGQTGTLFLKSLSKSIPEDLTNSTDPQPGTSGIIFKIENKEQPHEIAQRIENQVERQPRVLYPLSGEVYMGPDGSGTVQALNIIKTEIEGDTCSENSSISSDNTPTHSPHKQAFKIKNTYGNYSYSPSEYHYYHSNRKTHSTLSLRPEFESRPRASTSNPSTDDDLEECRGPFAPSPNSQLEEAYVIASTAGSKAGSEGSNPRLSPLPTLAQSAAELLTAAVCYCDDNVQTDDEGVACLPRHGACGII